MTGIYRQKIDIFPHIVPIRYKQALLELLPADSYWQRSLKLRPTVFDLGHRFRIMDKFEGLVQVLTLGAPAVELVAKPEKAVELAMLANDEMAELVLKYQERFVAAVACLPMNDTNGALKEVDRAINDLGFRGIQINTSINGRALDSPEFLPLYEKMSEYNLPIWLHPYRPETHPDYKTESKSMYRIFHMFGWPYETTAAMTRLVFSGVLERYPDLKIISHHCGGMVPYFESRIIQQQGYQEMRSKEAYERLTRPAVEYFKMFYADTAIRTTPALMCGYQFYGAENMLFGTDMPYDPELGEYSIRESINSIEQMDISEEEKKKIFEDNARRLLHLPV